uniref:RB_A domain-containing protein n=1 Tax=Macrostomum lignano TaxID=282301 RepID=A0A1I8FUJ7_9PLAT
VNQLRSNFLSAYDLAVTEADVNRNEMQRRANLTETLFYMTLDAILTCEADKVPDEDQLGVRLSSLLGNRTLLACLFAACSQVVLYSFGCSNSLAWCLEASGTHAFHLFKWKGGHLTLDACALGAGASGAGASGAGASGAGASGAGALVLAPLVLAPLVLAPLVLAFWWLWCWRFWCWRFWCWLIVESLIEAVDFPRDIVRHLRLCVDRVVDSLAWTAGSPLWKLVQQNRGRGYSAVECQRPLVAASATSPKMGKGLSALQAFYRHLHRLCDTRLAQLSSELHLLNPVSKQRAAVIINRVLRDNPGLLRNRHLDHVIACGLFAAARAAQPSPPCPIRFAHILAAHRRVANLTGSSSTVAAGGQATDTLFRTVPLDNRGNAGDIIQFYNAVFTTEEGDHIRQVRFWLLLSVDGESLEEKFAYMRHPLTPKELQFMQSCFKMDPVQRSTCEDLKRSDYFDRPMFEETGGRRSNAAQGGRHRAQLPQLQSNHPFGAFGSDGRQAKQVKNSHLPSILH